MTHRLQVIRPMFKIKVPRSDIQDVMFVPRQLWNLAVLCWTLQVGLGELSSSPEIPTLNNKQTTQKDGAKWPNYTESEPRLGRAIEAPHNPSTSGTAATATATRVTTTTSLRLPAVTSSRAVLHNQDVVAPESNEEAPPFIERPNSQARVIIPKSQFNHFMLHCQAQGRPQPTYKWYTNGTEVDGKNPKSVIFTNGTLVLRNLTKRYNTFHQCEARNQYGRSLSVRFQVVAEKEAATVSEAPVISFLVGDGQPLSIPCGETPPTIPDYNKKWYRRQSSSELIMNDRIGSDLNGTLHFAYIEKTDAGPNSNIFRCGLMPQNWESSSINMYGTYQIFINDAPKDDFLPRVQYAPNNIKAQIGRSVTLECFFSGRPVPKLTWTDNKNNGILGNQRFQLQDFNRKLVITEVRQEDEGYFVCTGSNSVGFVQTEIFLNVTSAPLRDSSFGPLTYPTEHDVTLNCTARAAIKENLDNPVWYRNGEVFKQENFPDMCRYRFNEDKTRLSIKNLNKSVDTACYQCNISNSEGYIFYDGYIRVIDSIKIRSKIPEMINLLTAPEIIDLTVTATKDACCTLTRKWYINGTLQADSKFENPPFFGLESSTGTLFINKSLVSRDQLIDVVGHYRLSLYNRYQTVDVTFSLNLEDFSTNENKPSEERICYLTTVLAVSTAVLLLVSLILGSTLVCYIKRGKCRLV